MTDVLTSEIHQELIDRLGYIQVTPKKVLLVGEFSLPERRKIEAIYPKAELHADLLSDKSDKSDKNFKTFEVIVASAVSPETPIFSSFFDRLSQGGMLLFSTFGPSVFCPKLQERYPDMHDTGDILWNLGFENPVMDTEFLHSTEVVFGHAWKPATAKQIKDAEGSIRVSIEGLLKSLKLKR